MLLSATLSLAFGLTQIDSLEDLLAAPSSFHESTSKIVSPALPPPPPVKLDKNLRRALLKALVDLEAESAEQHQQDEAEKSAKNHNNDQPKSTTIADEDKYAFLEISKQKSASYSFDFPSDADDNEQVYEEDVNPSEDKLQNSSYVESEKSVIGRKANGLTTSKDFTKDVQVSHFFLFIV